MIIGIPQNQQIRAVIVSKVKADKVKKPIK